MTYPDHEETTQTIREMIVDALRQGFGPEAIEDVIVGDDRTLVYVDGFDEPVDVGADGMTIPGCFPSRTAEGIQRDVDSILASLNGKGVAAA